MHYPVSQHLERDGTWLVVVELRLNAVRQNLPVFPSCSVAFEGLQFFLESDQIPDKPRRFLPSAVSEKIFDGNRS